MKIEERRLRKRLDNLEKQLDNVTKLCEDNKKLDTRFDNLEKQLSNVKKSYEDSKKLNTSYFYYTLGFGGLSIAIALTTANQSRVAFAVLIISVLIMGASHWYYTERFRKKLGIAGIIITLIGMLLVAPPIHNFTSPWMITLIGEIVLIIGFVIIILASLLYKKEQVKS
jgi:uncharacterized protein YigA (DUF484 family)